MSFANIFIMSARMSLSENTAAKRSVCGVWPQAGSMAPAASVAPAPNSVRRAMEQFMMVSCMWCGRGNESGGRRCCQTLRQRADGQLVAEGAEPADDARRRERHQRLLVDRVAPMDVRHVD